MKVKPVLHVKNNLTFQIKVYYRDICKVCLFCLESCDLFKYFFNDKLDM